MSYPFTSYAQELYSQPQSGAAIIPQHLMMQSPYLSQSRFPPPPPTGNFYAPPHGGIQANNSHPSLLKHGSNSNGSASANGNSNGNSNGHGHGGHGNSNANANGSGSGNVSLNANVNGNANANANNGNANSGVNAGASSDAAAAAHAAGATINGHGGINNPNYYSNNNSNINIVMQEDQYADYNSNGHDYGNGGAMQEYLNYEDYGSNGQLRAGKNANLPPNGANGFQQQGAPSRTVYLGNIPSDITPKELLDHVRSGVIENVKILPAKNCAFISFLDESSALLFHSDAILKRLTIKQNDIRIGWGKNSQLQPVVLNAVNRYGATRNVYLGNLSPDITEEELENDLKDFGPIDTIKIIPEKKIAFVHFTSILTAIRLVQNLPINEKYQDKKIFYGKDRCAFITKTQQHNAAQYLGLNPNYEHLITNADRDFISTALVQQSTAAAAIATSAGGANNLGNRTVYLGNLHPDSTIEEICNVVRGGILQNVRLISERHVCFITFIDPIAAAQFFAMASLHGLIIHNRKIKIGWGKHSGPLSNALTLAVGNGASRNIYVGGLELGDEQEIDEEVEFDEKSNIDLNNEIAKEQDEENKETESQTQENGIEIPSSVKTEHGESKSSKIVYTASKLRNDFGEFGEIEQINFYIEKNCAFVNFTNISNAIKAIDGIKYNKDYENLKINFGKDRCGNIPRQFQNGSSSGEINNSNNLRFKGSIGKEGEFTHDGSFSDLNGNINTEDFLEDN
ncbi:hypothetical protein PACTADRAFT_51744 [Pachysolen tannophilus NRRL Y-2460]|uniref:RRM domain-containing protein n=1 Tax=Pachysolen tannophilus NRRL Y-2460 TaxID=669874 RepID=A0A1E4TQG9_PACTA|nr:hypothetical protein PACTADRAFT_51744 [Pachysolen tannophilus NRRL Y-2460]